MIVKCHVLVSKGHNPVFVDIIISADLTRHLVSNRDQTQLSAYKQLLEATYFQLR